MMGYIFVLTWARVGRVVLGSVVSALCTFSGMVFVSLCVFSICVDMVVLCVYVFHDLIIIVRCLWCWG